MGFTSEARKDSTCQAWAAQLYRALNGARLIQRSPKLIDWTNQLAQLAREVPPARVQRVLDWYCGQLKHPMSIQAYSGKTFRAKFDRIEAAMLGATPLNVTIDQDAQRGAERLCNDYTWPARVKIELPSLVQISRDRISALHAKMRAEMTRLDEWDRDNRFLIRVTEGHLHPNVAECEWMPFINRKYCRRDFLGDVLLLAFNAASRDFREHFWWEWVQGWSSLPDVKQYDPLLDRLTATP